MLSEVGAIERDVVIGMHKPSRITGDRCTHRDIKIIQSMGCGGVWLGGYSGFETRSTWDLKRFYSPLGSFLDRERKFSWTNNDEASTPKTNVDSKGKDVMLDLGS